MRRLVALVVVLTVSLPATAMATELDELLSESQDATYSAEQTISCSTPDGVRDAVVRITQKGGEMSLSSNITDDIEIAVGSGTWSMRQGGGIVAEAAVGEGERETTEPLYTIEDAQGLEYLGRAAMSYILIRDGEPRAELTFDDETGALVDVVTFTLGGDIYCERRFISLETDVTEDTTLEAAPAPGVSSTIVDDSVLPEEVSGFSRLDQYEDEDGLRFAYYSDGFFSFALFETPNDVSLPEAKMVELESGVYRRAFTAGQVTYVWQTGEGAMALVGDLPPDLHESVLAEMPHPQTPGFLRRWWRNIFG